MNETAVYPHIGDPVIWRGTRGTIVMLLAGEVTVDQDDDVRVTVREDRLRWVFDRGAWVLVAEGTE